ncbi:conserved fungal cell surface protein, Kre9/Knh1 family, Knh2 [Schizosaccharomyces osmophilus]|uniref:Conserved fungal cell surface protein, Kre9/Knh1 family, Knh2 n=1 Tax=Schizosaccharomyces osmophilus TaxID=2545709 RepID=A0AAF0AX87_9SCHI|nr:conserved fungal cell surface protein, Kre9/Knh1 family, Knh2 [Schizosaccharomyces osmophilus]WBW75616.1 conserved fungal cell surface protein, Kre9/Knh1 family, Knh2 [Schizosaccharomyces osmophilus]
MLFKSAGFLLCLASAFVAQAIQLNSPNKDTVWKPGQTNTVSWDAVSTDPHKTKVILMNMNNYPNRRYDLGTVDTSEGHLTTNIQLSSDLPHSGWQIYLDSADEMNTGSLAQSHTFTIEGSGTSLSSGGISGGIVSSTSSSASSTPASSSSASSSGSSSSAPSSSSSSGSSSSAPSSSVSSSGSLTSDGAKTASGSSSSGFSTKSGQSSSASNSKDGSSSSHGSSSSSGAATEGMTKVAVVGCIAVAALMVMA